MNFDYAKGRAGVVKSSERKAFLLQRGFMTEEQRIKDITLLSEANKSLAKMDIKGKDYIPVNERVKAFRTIYPRGQIITEIIGLADGVVTMKASVYDDDGRLLATGHAQEKESSSFINKTSFIENCETSCTGRALGNAGIGLDYGFASYEEIANAKLQQESNKKLTQKQFDDLKKMYSTEEIKAMYKELGITKATDIPVEYYEKKKADWDKKFAEAHPDKEFY